MGKQDKHASFSGSPQLSSVFAKKGTPRSMILEALQQSIVVSFGEMDRAFASAVKKSPGFQY
jgi:hypothetical protein